MSDQERRISPRKECAVPLRFRVIANGNGAHADEAETGEQPASRTESYSPSYEGEALNLSERGLYFRSREKLNVGAPLEIHFTLPRELTGRNPEPMRCSARVVHVEQQQDQRGMTGIGAVVERFEPVIIPRSWSH
ncbi:MAG: PilZ domain-containing protein [Candidatus Acidiferrales bacterium]|jgi:hypothetical protein